MPKPRPGEDRSRFITRCVSDAESIADFPNTQQRVAFCYAQYERYSKPAISKQFKQVWQTSVERERGKMERQYIAKLRKWYNAEYAKGVQQFVDEGRIIVQGLFPVAFLSKFYEEYYEETGLHFANWYFKNYKKFVNKQSADQYQNQWRTSFASYGAAVAKTNVTLVQGTALKTLIALTTKLSRDPEFMAVGAAEQARILRRQFDGYSKYQAERFIRTETTAISNKAILESATTIFPKDQLQKEWSTALDGRERASHRAADGQTVPYDQPFIVQGEELMQPGDRNGSASNVVNCRCAAIPVPIEDAVAVEGLENIGVGLAGENLTGGLTAADVASIAATIGAPKPIPTPKPKPNTFEEVIQNNKNVPENIVELFSDQDGLNLELFTHFTAAPLKLRIKNIRAEHRKGLITMGKIKNLYERKQTFIHESGHFVADSRKWIVKGLVEKDKAVAPLEKLFNKWSKYALDKKNTKRLYFELEELKPFETFETLGKKLGYENVTEYRNDIGALKDVFGALTKERIGGGHGKAYYNKKNSQWHEFIAHAYENKFIGNKVFKHLYPKLYDDMVNLVDELNANF